MENFYIGQDIVAIKNHSQGKFKEGDVFSVKDMNNECSCGLSLNIGIVDPATVGNIGRLARCSTCKDIFIIKSEYIYFLASSFKPLDSLVNISELTKILEEPVESLFCN